jgi:hypothetical protein
MIKHSRGTSYPALIACALALLAASPAPAGSILLERFDGDLSGWLGQNGGPHHGQLVADPLRSGNTVLAFTQLNNGGDMYSATVFEGGKDYVLSFEYLGLPKSGSVADNYGGFIGFNDGDTDAFTDGWLFGTQEGYNGGTPLTVGHLIDDGQWRTYSAVFRPTTASFRITIEDWISSGGVAGDAYFDNISLSAVQAVPLPAAVWGGLALLCVLPILPMRRRYSTAG